jgi:RNA polymerase sigma-70 factor (ECF subfamily)
MMETARDARTDEALVREARNGDGEAMDLLVVRHHGAVFRTAVAILGDEDLADDAAQETFIRVVKALDRFRGESSFRTWALSIAANVARGLLRTGLRRREAPLEAAPDAGNEDPDVIQRISVEERAGSVKRSLERLPEKQRLAVSLRIFEGLSFREVGELIDSSEGAARVNYHHGIRRLRELAGDE